jgi:hypothetical protein
MGVGDDDAKKKKGGNAEPKGFLGGRKRAHRIASAIAAEINYSQGPELLYIQSIPERWAIDDDPILLLL